MRLNTAIQLSIRSLRLNILRTSLTVLGIIVGVAAIVVVFAAGDGISSLITGEVASYGTDTIQTETKVPSKKNTTPLAQVTTLKLSDMEAIDRLDNIRQSYGAILGQQKVSWQSQNQRVFLFGISAPYTEIDKKVDQLRVAFLLLKRIEIRQWLLYWVTNCDRIYLVINRLLVNR